ncbi:reverse transcriptase domain-containing protein [Tanacetum coccineum]
MKEEFPIWFGSQLLVQKSELFALAYGPTPTPISVNSCIVNGVRFVVHSRDERRTTQNNGICSPGGNDGEMYYGQLQEILEFSYLSFKVVLFRVKWFDTRIKDANGEAFKNDQYILATQVKQCFYLEDMARRPLGWKVVEHVSHKKFSNGGVIVVEDDPDVIHVDNSSDLALSTSLNDLEIAALHIDGQSIDVDAPPDIIDVVDEDDDIIDEEDPIPHDLADSDDEDLVNLDIDDGVNVMSADVARGHGGDGGGDDRPPPYQIPTGCGGCLGNRGKGTRKPNLGGRRAGRLHTRQETRNLGLKAITDKSGPVPIRFEFGDRETLMPLGDHAAHWANYLGELVRELPLHYPSWRQMPPERKAGVVAKIGTQFDLRPHMESDRWPQIYTGIQQHLQKIYNGKKAALKERHWVPDEDKTYDVERIRRGRPSHISKVDWDAQIAFWNDPKNLARAAQNKQNRAKSKVMESSATREYPSLIHTFFLTHTVGGVFMNPEDKALYDEMLRLQGLGSNTSTGVPYTEDKIMAIVRGGKQWGHIPGVGRVLPGQGIIIPPPPPCTHSSDVAKLKKSEKRLTKQVMMRTAARMMRMRRMPIVRRCWLFTHTLKCTNRNTNYIIIQQDMDSTSPDDYVSDEANEIESMLFAGQLATACTLPMVWKAAIELDLLDIIAKHGPMVSVHASELADQLGVKVNNPEAPVMLDRMCSLLASHSVLTCSHKETHDGVKSTTWPILTSTKHK